MKEISWSNPFEEKLFKKILRTGIILAGGMLAFFLGALLLPALAQSGSAADTHTFWYLSRASGIIAFVFLWISMVLGLLMSTRSLPKGRGFAIGNDLHQFVSLYGLFFTLFHGVILLWDPYINMTPLQLVVPFTVFNYQPLSVGGGQISLYLWIALVFSSYVRKSIGRATWRVLHYLSFGVFWMVLLHGISAGSDTGTAGMQILYWSSAASMVFLTTYRILSAIFLRNRKEMAALPGQDVE
jgi:predicted ferric reductase